MSDRDSGGLPRLEVGGRRGRDDDVLEGLKALQYTLLRHPAAAQAAFSALVAEGRRFGSTPEGQRWRDRLRTSDLVRRGRVVWEVATLKMLEEVPSGPLPSTYVDALVKASTHPEIEALLSQLFQTGFETGNDDGDEASPSADR